MAMARRGREPGYRIVVAVVVMVVCVLLALIAVAESARPWAAGEREVGVAVGGQQEEKQRRGLLVVEEEEDAVPPSGTMTPTQQEEEASPRKPHIECDEVSSDVESCSPPAQRQTDRSMWGMSKRLVPTGPNPLHN